MPDRWLVADEWFAQFIRDVEGSAGRVTRLRREAGRGVPKQHRDAVAYEAETENYRKYLRFERSKDAEVGNNPHIPVSRYA